MFGHQCNIFYLDFNFCMQSKKFKSNAKNRIPANKDEFANKEY